ncbi:MAG: HAD hydrolase family protein [Planctomycetota bacterium]
MTDAGNNRFRAVICDIDGCLSPEDSSAFDTPKLAQVYAHNRRAIETGTGPIVTACSGRPIAFVEAMCRLIGNDRLPAIGENGVWIYDPVRNEMEIDPAIASEHREAIRQLETWVRSQWVPRGVAIQPGKAASVSLWHADTRFLLDELLPIVKGEVDRHGWPMRISNTWFYINCDLDFISKATAIKRWMERTGMAPSQLAGIGDTLSDLKIRDEVSWFGCPANADERLREVADFVAPHEQAEGVLDILDALSGNSSEVVA